MIHRKKIFIIFLLAVVFVMVFFSILNFFFNLGKRSMQITTNSVLTRSYESEKLGVRFTYADQDDLGKKILVQESGDTIYVYPEGTRIEDGQSVQVFSKEQNFSLRHAVEVQFLQGYDRSQCYVISGVDPKETKPEKGIAAIIAYPISETNDSWLMNAEKCPDGYSFTNGISYFWTDREYSNKYVFFSIGQYYIPASSVGTSWHTTLEFVP